MFSYNSVNGCIKRETIMLPRKRMQWQWTDYYYNNIDNSPYNKRHAYSGFRERTPCTNRKQEHAAKRCRTVNPIHPSILWSSAVTAQSGRRRHARILPGQHAAPWEACCDIAVEPRARESRLATRKFERPPRLVVSLGHLNTKITWEAIS